jgi:hypothetical protein
MGRHTFLARMRMRMTMSIHAVKDFLTTDGHRWTQMKNVVFKHHGRRLWI